MAKAHIGKLPAKHALLMNPHGDQKLSRCPHCRRQTFARKFAFLLHVDGWGPMVYGMTCKYCARCRMIMVSQDELEEQLRRMFAQLDPNMLGHKYLVMGVVETKVFTKVMAEGRPLELDKILEHVSDIRKYHGLGLQPGGWYREGEQPTWPAYRDERIPRAPGCWSCWTGKWKFITEEEMARRRKESGIDDGQ